MSWIGVSSPSETSNSGRCCARSTLLTSNASWMSATGSARVAETPEWRP